MPLKICVASPCSADWNRMSGDDRVRFCSLCQLNVYNFSSMSSAEIDKLLTENQGRRVCGRYFVRTDGTMITEDCPVGFRLRVHRVSRWAGAALSAIMSVGFAAAQSTAQKPPDLIQIQPGQGEVDLTVVDVEGAVVQSAKITMENASTQIVTHGSTNSFGRYQVFLPQGTYTLCIDFMGFAPFQKTLRIEPQQTSTITVSLDTAQIEMGVIVEQTYAGPELERSAPVANAIPNSLPTPRGPGAPSQNAHPKSSLSRFFHKLGF